jgi:hypothetical protein
MSCRSGYYFHHSLRQRMVKYGSDDGRAQLCRWRWANFFALRRL